MRAIGSALAAAILMISSALADTPASPQAPLAAGKPAGTRQAQLGTNGILLFAGIVAVAAAIAVVASGESTTSTSGTTG